MGGIQPKWEGVILHGANCLKTGLLVLHDKN